MTAVARQNNYKTLLNNAELRATSARLAVMKLLDKTGKPVDVTTVKKFLNKKNIDTDPATIFRIMNMLTLKGLTKLVSFNEGKFRYELATKPHHHHLVCNLCSKVEDFSYCAILDLETNVHKKNGFEVNSHSLELYGKCARCKKRKG